MFVRGVHEEASEDMVTDLFRECGEVRNVALNLDRRTGFAKGYALVEFEAKDEAERAIRELDGRDFLDKPLSVSWAFVKEDKHGRGGR